MKSFAIASLITCGSAAHVQAGITLDDLSIGTIVHSGPNSNYLDEIQSTTVDNLDGPNGIFSGGTWNGGDHVYTVHWEQTRNFNLILINEFAVLDLFVWSDNTATNLIAQSVTTRDFESIGIDNLAAGTYYISIDSYAGADSLYNLYFESLPAAPSAAVFGIAALCFTRRRRA